uniref:MAGE domain-containing protein n=1 Tax=Myotis lucifugus TaxID=59463 RepID=G1Q0G4_MYOLU
PRHELREVTFLLKRVRVAHSETQGLEAAQVLKTENKAFSSCSSLIPSCTIEDISIPGAPSTPQGSQSAYSAFSVIRATSSSKSDEPRRDRKFKHSQSLPDTESLPLGPLDEKVKLLVNFLLHKYQMNKPITKGDIDAVIKEYRDDFPEILRKASEHMELVFGINVEEVDPTSHSYARVNKSGLTYDPRLSSDEGVPKVIILATNTTGEIWETLNMMDLSSGMLYFIFGKPKRL